MVPFGLREVVNVKRTRLASQGRLSCWIFRVVFGCNDLTGDRVAEFDLVQRCDQSVTLRSRSQVQELDVCLLLVAGMHPTFLADAGVQNPGLTGNAIFHFDSNRSKNIDLAFGLVGFD